MSSLVLRQSDVLRFLQSGNTKYAIYAVNLLLVIWIASQLATLTWGLFAPSESNLPVAAAPRNIPVRTNLDRQLIGQLPGWHLLGLVQENTAPVKTAIPADAPDTHLKLTLRGALASDDPVNARAIIADPKGKDEQYSIGDALPGNAELSEIYPDRVILKRGGRYETLRLPQDARSPGSQSARFTPAARSRVNSSPQARLAAVRQQIQQNPRSIFGLLRTRAETDEAGDLIGYAISPGSNPEMFTELGLVDGDVVIQVNDMKLSDPANGARALQAMKSGEPVSVVLKRNGQEQVVTLGGQ